MKIIYGFIHEELVRFSNFAGVALASGSPPDDVKALYRLMSSGSHKLTSSGLTSLTDTYKAYEPHLEVGERVMTLAGILSACAHSALTASNTPDLEFLVSTLAKTLILGGWSRIDRDPTFLESVCRAMRQVVIEHLPLMSDQAMATYFANSRRFTQFSRKESNNSFRLHDGSDVLEERDIVESHLCSIPNQALMAVIFHFCKQDGPVITDRDFLRQDEGCKSPGGALDIMGALAARLKMLADSDLYLPIKMPDLVVVSLLIERFALAACSTPVESEKEVFAQGVSSLINLVLKNRPHELISKDYNLFLADSPGFNFYEAAVARRLTESLLTSSTAQAPLPGHGGQAVQDLYWAVVRNCLQVHAKHSAAGYDNQGLISGLVDFCVDRLAEPKALQGFKPDQQAMVVAGIKDPELKKRLLVDYKKCRGQVLTNDLGM